MLSPHNLITVFQILPYKHTTCFPRWNDVKRVVSSWNTRGLFVGQMPKDWDFSRTTKCCIHFCIHFDFALTERKWNHENAASWAVRCFPQLIDLSLKMFYVVKLSSLDQNFVAFHRRPFNRQYTEAQPRFLKISTMESFTTIIND